MKRDMFILLFTAGATSSLAQCLFRGAFQSTVQDCTVGKEWLELQPMGFYPNAQWTFSLDGSSVQPFLSHWTQTGGHWRYNTPLTAGYHTLDLPGFTDQQGNTFCWDTYSFQCYLAITPGDCGFNLRMRLALDGALPSGVLMTDALRTAGLVPLNQPYTSLGYVFTGSPTNVAITPAMLAVTGSNAIVDWIVVEVRSATTPTTILYSKPALLERDGDVIDADGDPYVNCPIPAANHYISIRHRNHLGVMTAQPEFRGLDPNVGRIDFTGTTNGWYQGTFGVDARVLKGSVWCMWAGDATGNGQIRYTGSANDRDPILVAVGSTTPNATVTNVYDRRDTNLDGVIKYTGSANDRDLILNNVGSTTPNAVRIEQVP